MNRTTVLDFRIPFDAMGLGREELLTALEDAFAVAVSRTVDLTGYRISVEAEESAGTTGIAVLSGYACVSLDTDEENGREPDLVRKHFMEPVLGGVRSVVGGDPILLVFGEVGCRSW
ncbi:MAG: hypothetical protein Q7U75_18075, partial [Desulfobacterales bacterium]|nr:hypothetical protein [Desulfobacterales bacterium]